MEIKLGPSGSPKPTTLEGLSEIRRLGLEAMELSFTHGVRMSNIKAKEIGDANKAENVRLSIHAPYYINLCSEDAQVREESMKRILDSCERGHYMGATKVVFHPAYYGKMEKDAVFSIVYEKIKKMMNHISHKNWKVALAPEISGKLSQFGSLEEIMELSEKAGCSFCIDISHLYARGMGKLDYGEIFGALSTQKHLHIHFSGIEFGKGGEKRHLPIEGNKPDFREFARHLARSGIDSTIICESPLTWRDSLKMKEILEI